MSARRAKYCELVLVEAMIPFWEKLSAPDGTVKRDLRELMSAVDVDAMVCLCERIGVDDEYDGTMGE